MRLGVLFVTGRTVGLRKRDARVYRGAACALCLLICSFSSAQQPPPAEPGATQAPAASSSQAPLPDAPTVSRTGDVAPQSSEEQTKRIMGMLPNFRSVTAGTQVAPESTHDKLMTATLDNFDYTALFFAGWIAADSFATRATPEFHQGAAGYARYYWHTVADQSVENYLVELIVPALTHKDSRYFAMGKEGGSVRKRIGYSLSRVLQTRTDSGRESFNTSEIAGSAAAVSISMLYYPSKERTVSNGLRNWGLDITYDAVTFAFHEFWPDIHHAVFHKRGRKNTSGLPGAPR